MLSPAAWLALALTAAYFCSGVHFYDYCKMEVNCSKGKHIACHPEQMVRNFIVSCIPHSHKEYFQFSKSGRGVPTKNWTRIVMTKELRQVLIDAHNEKRNSVACGDGAIKDKDGKTYPKATRMRELVGVLKVSDSHQLYQYFNTGLGYGTRVYCKNACRSVYFRSR